MPLRAAAAACAVAASLTLAQAPGSRPPPAAGMQRFESRTRTFHLDLPADWRQLSPGEARQLRSRHPDWPQEVLFTEPGQTYAVGPVDRWLQGDFDGVFLYVVEQANEWQLADADPTAALQRLWDDAGRQQGVRYEVRAAARTAIGTEGYAAIQCQRRRLPADGAPASCSLDTFLPTGGRQLSLSLNCPEADFDRREEVFRRWLATLALARKARGPQTLSDRLWTPIVTGALVGLALLLLYRWSRRRV